jgi:hypothetical protein
MVPLALVLLAVLLLPASAAAVPSGDILLANGGFSGKFGSATFTSIGQEQVICNGFNNVSGAWTTTVVAGKNNGVNGKLSFVFNNCHTQLGVACTTMGQAAGVITTPGLRFELAYIKGSVKTTGVLIKGATYAEFSCGSNLVKVTGKGVLGHLSTPACGGNSATWTTDFTSKKEGVQTYQEIEGSPELFVLEESVKGGAPAQTSIDMTMSYTFSNSGSGELTCN